MAQFSIRWMSTSRHFGTSVAMAWRPSRLCHNGEAVLDEALSRWLYMAVCVCVLLHDMAELLIRLSVAFANS